MNKLKSLVGATTLIVCAATWAHAQIIPGQSDGSVAKPVRTSTSGSRAPADAASRNYFTDLPLVTQDGKSVRFYSDVLKDRVVMINFIYTDCTDACPLITYKLTQVKDALGESFGRDVYFVSISIDPERDTPEALSTFAARQKAVHPGWTFLTGEKDNVDVIVKKLGQYTAETQAHSTLLLAGNVKTRHWAKVPPSATVAEMVLRVQMLVSER